jgi:predicted enzyme related to lactoylglutathione lyase
MVGWFEIPVSDMERAMSFYQTVFGVTLARHSMGPLDMAWFPMEDGQPGAGGSLVRHESYRPSATDGPLIYFSSRAGNLADELGRVTAAGGKVLLEKRQITPDVGYMALFLDSEGNRIALHSRQ